MDWYSYSFLIDSDPLSAGEPLVVLDVHHPVLQVSVSLGQINLQDYLVRNRKYVFHKKLTDSEFQKAIGVLKIRNMFNVCNEFRVKLVINCLTFSRVALWNQKTFLQINERTQYKTMTSLPYLQEVSQQIFQIGREMGWEANLTRDKY